MAARAAQFLGVGLGATTALGGVFLGVLADGLGLGLRGRPHGGGRLAGGLQDRGDFFADRDEVGGLAGGRRVARVRAVGRLARFQLPAEDLLGLLQLGDGTADAVEKGVDFGLVVAFRSIPKDVERISSDERIIGDMTAFCTCWSRGFQVECCESSAVRRAALCASASLLTT